MDKEKKARIINMYKPTKSTRRCAFCRSYACYERVFTRDGAFDEVACRRHIKELQKLSDIMLPGVSKVFSSSTGPQSRGNAAQ